jgi:uncharacterized protein YidB (DUF937 family)
MEISGDQLQRIFVSSAIGDLASRLGMPTGRAGSLMTQVVPELINQLARPWTSSENSDEHISDELSKLAKSAREMAG